MCHDLALFLRYSEILVKNADFSLPATPSLFGPRYWNFAEIFGIRKLVRLLRRCLRDPGFNLLGRTPTYDRRTNTR